MASAPSFARASSEPVVSQIGANKDGFDVSGTANASTGSDDTDTEQLARDSGECRVGLRVFAVTIRFKTAVRVSCTSDCTIPGAGKRLVEM